MKKILYTIFLLVCFFKISAQVVDEKFKPSFLAAYTANVLEQQSDGKILIGFEGAAYLNTNPVKNMCRVLEDGTFDPSFKYPDNISNNPKFIKHLENGKILIGGRFWDKNGQFLGNLLRLMPNGELDKHYKSLANEKTELTSGLLISSQKLLIGGVSYQNSQDDKLILKIILPDGSIDSTFKINILPSQTQEKVEITSLASQSKNQLIIGGTNIHIGNSTRDIFRIDTLGKVDPDFAPKVNTESNLKVWKLITLPNGFIAILTDYGFHFQMFDPNGISLLSLKEQNQNPNIFALNDNSVLSVGLNSHIIKTNGDIYRLSNLNFNGYVFDCITQKNGQLVLSGLFSKIDGKFFSGLARLSKVSDLKISEDSFWKSGMYTNGIINDMVAQQDGKIVVGGFFNLVNGEKVNHIVRLMPDDGSIDKSFNLHLGDRSSVWAIKSLENRDLLVASQNRPDVIDSKLNGLQIVNPDGIIKRSLPFPYSLYGSAVNCLEIDIHRRVYASEGESISSYSKSPPAFIRYNPENKQEIEFNQAFMGDLKLMHGFKILPNQKIIMFGEQLRYDKSDTTCLIQALASGKRDLSFNLSFSKSALAEDVLPLDTNTILVGGGYKRINSSWSEQAFLLKIQSDGQIDTTFKASLQNLPNYLSHVYKLFQLSENRILVCGVFNTYNGVTGLKNAVIIDRNGNFVSSFLPTTEFLHYEQVVSGKENTFFLAGNFNGDRGSAYLAKIKSTTTPTRQIKANTQAKQARIFPNPVANRELQLEIEEKWASQALQYQIMELGSGKALLNGSLAPGQNRSLVLPQSLLKGSYLLRLNNGEEQEGHVFLVAE